MNSPALRLLPLLLSALPVLAQKDATIAEARVREVVSWLASDERQGRDTPSPGLDAAADYIAERFQQAGLAQAVKDSWFHGYTLPGIELDSNGIALSVRVVSGGKTSTVKLQPGADVRLLRAGDAQQGEDQEATVAYADDPRVERMLLAGGGRRPVVLELPEDHASWRAADGARRTLKQRLLGSAPVFLVRKGLLPAADDKAQFTVTWSTPAPKAMDVPLRNVVGLLRGSSKPDEYVLVSAHYDHIGTGRAIDGDGIYNGADDDASGTTAVILLAEALGTQKLARSVLFVCFSAEEKGLRGSAAFAETPPVPLDRVVANLNIEMIGRPETGKQQAAWITGVEFSDFAAIATPALQRGGIQLVPFDMAKQLFWQSDNLSLARKGVVAHSLSAGSLHKDYHQPSDQVEKLDLPHMTQVIHGCLEVVREFANRDARPSYNEEGRKVIERLNRPAAPRAQPAGGDKAAGDGKQAGGDPGQGRRGGVR